jgi:voltage-gated potassium channel
MHRFVKILIILASLVTGGMLAFRFLEGGKPEATWLNCCYMAVTTLTTVGFGEIIPLSPAGRIFVMGYLLVGFSVFTYSAFTLGQLLVSNELQGILEKRRMNQTIRALRDHYLVCGIGRMGETICRQLHERKRPFVIIDRNESRLAIVAKPQHWNYIVGDATDDEILRSAGISHAKSLAAVLPTDADNVYVVLSARLLQEDLQIIARAGDEKAAAKLLLAGANRVVSPYTTAANKMARFMLNPNIEDFLDITDRSGRELELADVQIGSKSPLIGKKLMETDLRDLGVMVIGIRRADGERLMPPTADAEIRTGDCLFVFGNSDVVNKLVGDEMA